MSRIRPALFHAALAFLFITIPLTSQAGRFDLKKTERILSDLIEDAIEERGIPSISIALVKEDKIVWTAAFGYSNVRTKTLATSDTIYSTGSTFKSATATALMQLQEQGKLSLGQPINNFLEDNPVQDRLQVEKPVTFEHILSHWSGLTAGATIKPIWGRTLPKSLEEFTSDLYSVRAPEETWEYNNFAYGTAGLLVEKISGQEYEEYVLEHILKPLGVTTPHPVYPSADMVELMALPYNAGGSRGEPEAVAQVHFDVYPAGDIYLTAEDMARFLGAHLNGGVFNGNRILSEESVQNMHEPRFDGTYALGFSVSEEENGHTIIQHGGGIPGQSSMMMGDLDAKVGVYYMSNSGAPEEIGKAALALLRGDDYTPPSKKAGIKVASKTLDQYVGTFASDEGISLTFSREGSTLLAQPSGTQSMWALPAEDSTTFYYPAFDGTVTFGKNEEGQVDHLVIKVGEQEITAQRKN
jgi:CubicO group peptidase (beta-lactamase class C family)